MSKLIEFNYIFKDISIKGPCHSDDFKQLFVYRIFVFTPKIRKYSKLVRVCHNSIHDV